MILDSFGGLLFMTFARFFGGGVRKEALDIFRFSSGTPPLPKRSFQRLASSKISPFVVPVSKIDFKENLGFDLFGFACSFDGLRLSTEWSHSLGNYRNRVFCERRYD